MENIKDLLLKQKELSKKIDDSITKFIGISKKHFTEWKSILCIEDYRKSMKNFYIESMLNKKGLDFFTYNDDEFVQHDFEDFIKNLDDSNRFHYDKTSNRFFTLPELKHSPIVRDKIENKSNDFDQNGNLVYKYSATNYCGFGRTVFSLNYEIVLDLNTSEVLSLKDDNIHFYYSNSMTGSFLQTSFIK